MVMMAWEEFEVKKLRISGKRDVCSLCVRIYLSPDSPLLEGVAFFSAKNVYLCDIHKGNSISSSKSLKKAVCSFCGRKAMIKAEKVYLCYKHRRI
jgi:hypothetical protein